ncbi:MAG TPA: hypothetical protein VFJ16_28185 [Longimicrobium sp.]|nr:hypothetical protein [Longimicrobium sp.]
MDASKAERLAALLDGNCTERERQELLAELAAGGDDLEVFADAAAVLHEHEEEEAAAGVIPLHRPVREQPPRPRWKPPRWAKLAVAAGLVALIGGGLLWRGRGTGAGDVLALLEQPALGVPAGVRLKPWGASRGDGEAGKGRDVQLGARLADVEQLAGHDNQAASAAARDVARLLRGRHADPVARQYGDLASGIVPPGGADPEFTRRAIELGGKAAETGVWMEMARFAAAREDSVFFRSSLSLDILNGKGPASVFETERAELRRIGEMVGSEPPRWAEVRTALDSLLRRLAS